MNFRRYFLSMPESPCSSQTHSEPKIVPPFQDLFRSPQYALKNQTGGIMQITPSVPRSLPAIPQPLKSKDSPPCADRFQPGEPTSAPAWKKVVNAGAWSVAGGVAGATATVMVGGALVSGPEALGVLLFTPAGAAVGAIAGAVIGWNLLNQN